MKIKYIIVNNIDRDVLRIDWTMMIRKYPFIFFEDDHFVIDLCKYDWVYLNFNRNEQSHW